MENPLGSDYISLYIPVLVIIRIHYNFITWPVWPPMANCLRPPPGCLKLGECLLHHFYDEMLRIIKLLTIKSVISANIESFVSTYKMIIKVILWGTFDMGEPFVTNWRWKDASFQNLQKPLGLKTFIFFWKNKILSNFEFSLKNLFLHTHDYDFIVWVKNMDCSLQA